MSIVYINKELVMIGLTFKETPAPGSQATSIPQPHVPPQPDPLQRDETEGVGAGEAAHARRCRLRCKLRRAQLRGRLLRDRKH